MEGDKWELFIPSDLGYGEGGSGSNIGPGDALVFTMELLKINGGKNPASRCEPASHKNCMDHEIKYIKSKAELGVAELKGEIERLAKMKGNKMSPKAADWMTTRTNLLSKMVAAKDEL